MALEYLELHDNSKEMPNNLLAMLLRRRHPVNPDFKDGYASVVSWYLEVEIESGRVLREIGLNAAKKAIVLGPFGRNDGLWMGLPVSVTVEESPKVAREVFEAAWQKLASEHKDRVPPKRTAPRLPVATEEQLVGLWSSNIIAVPGGMRDEVIAFLPDGRGFFEADNATTVFFDVFRWRLMEPGVMSLTGATHHYLNDCGQVVQVASEFNYPRIQVDIQRHYSGAGSSIDVLYLPLCAGAGRWESWLAEVFGRCPVRAEDIKYPSFRRAK